MGDEGVGDGGGGEGGCRVGGAISFEEGVGVRVG